MTPAQLMALKPLADFVVTLDNTSPEYFLKDWKNYRRDVRRIVYECPVADDATVPEDPINPGGLSPVGWVREGVGYYRLHWTCESREINRTYGVPLSSRYREVWIYQYPEYKEN